jgi:quinol-cytochrome oxidoreductase complex cytochrome b subunit
MDEQKYPGSEHHHASEYASEKVVPFWPEHLLKELMVGLMAVAVLAIFAGLVPVTLGPPADPGDWAFQPAPDWYFYWVQNLFDVGGYYWSVLGLINYDWVLMFALPVIGILVFLGVPFIDRSPERRLLKRPLMLALLVAGFTFFGFFTANGVYNHAYLVAHEPEAIYSTSCATCHALGSQGNQTGVVTTNGVTVFPPPLTHVGSILSPAEIRQQLVHPVGGMPQLNLPPAAVSYLVSWLSSKK